MAAKALMLARRTFRPCPRDLTQSNLRARLRQQELPSSNALRRVGETGTRARRSHGLSDFETDLKSATRWLCREGFDDAEARMSAIGQPQPFRAATEMGLTGLLKPAAQATEDLKKVSSDFSGMVATNETCRALKTD